MNIDNLMDSKEKISDLSMIFLLARMISNTTKSDVFFNYYPHTNSIMIIVYVDGWSQNAEGEHNTIWLDEEDRLKDMLNKLEGMLKK